MRTPDECEEYKQLALQRRSKCRLCQGKNAGCQCLTEAVVKSGAYEACVPMDFWGYGPKSIKHNKPQFDQSVEPYVKRIKTARLNGYGLIFLGDNGVGKTTFISYVLMQAIRAGMTSYYTTMPQLDYDIKRGFNSKEHAERLELMLSSDFLALDEMGKERFKGDNDTYMRTQVERILKRRFDNSLPVLMAANADMEEVNKLYGNSIASIIGGKYKTVMMEPGDFREQLQGQMDKDMGYDIDPQV